MEEFVKREMYKEAAAVQKNVCFPVYLTNFYQLPVL